MPEDGSKLRDVEVLADEQSALSFEIPVSRLPRLVQVLSSPEGTARGEVRFSRDLGVAVAEVSVSAEVARICQRCMGPMSERLESQSRVYLPHTEAAAEGLPAEVEAMIAPEGRLRISALVDEDLMLALPLVAMHADDEPCATRGQEPGSQVTMAEVQRPFAALGDLMGRAGRDEPKRRK